MGAKSPLTGGIKESNVGGNAAFKMARLGIAGIVVENQPTDGKLYYLLLTKDGASVHPAFDLQGVNNYELCERLHTEHGKHAGIISIGACGEMKMCSASVAVTEPWACRLDTLDEEALAGSWVPRDSRRWSWWTEGADGVTYQDKEGFKQASEVFRDALRTHPVTKPGGGLAVYGTNVLVNVINEAGVPDP